MTDIMAKEMWIVLKHRPRIIPRITMYIFIFVFIDVCKSCKMM